MNSINTCEIIVIFTPVKKVVILGVNFNILKSYFSVITHLLTNYSQTQLYSMVIKKVPISCVFLSRFLDVQCKRNIWNTARSVSQ